jgi:hypothetical protein
MTAECGCGRLQDSEGQLQSERDDMGENGGGRPELSDRLEYMTDLISQLERMAREQGLTRLAAILQQAREEARNGRGG